MKLSLFALIAFSVSAFAAQPLIQYSWHNQVGDSQLVIFDDGSVTHHERQMYELHKIPEKKLSEAKVEKLKKLLNDIANAKIEQSRIDASMGSHSGTLEVSTEKGMVIVEGIIRDIHDVYRAKSYHSQSAKINELNELIFNYTTLDMEI